MATLRHVLDNIRFLFAHMLGTIEATAADKYYYGYIFAQGRDFIASEVKSEDPFRLSSLEIVERVLAAGYQPYVESERRYPVAASGRVERIEHLDQRFIVSVDPVAETLSVQEIRDEPYERKADLKHPMTASPVSPTLPPNDIANHAAPLR